jgi:hypothetical protein
MIGKITPRYSQATMDKPKNPFAIVSVIFIITSLAFASLGIYLYLGKTKLEKEKSDHALEVSTLKQQLKGGDTSKLTADHAKLEADITEKNQEISDLKSLIKTQSEAGGNKPGPEQTEELKLAKEEIATLKLQIESLRGENDSLKKTSVNAEKDKEIALLRGQLEDSKTDFDNFKKTSGNLGKDPEVTSLKSQLDSLQAKYDDLTKTSGNVEKDTEIASLKSQLESLQGKFDDLKKTHEAFEKDPEIVSLKSLIETLRVENENLKNIAESPLLPQKENTSDPISLFEQAYQIHYSPNFYSLERNFDLVKWIPDYLPSSFDSGYSLFFYHMQRLFIEGVITNSPTRTSNVCIEIYSDFSTILKDHLNLGMIRIPGQSDELVKSLYNRMISILTILDPTYVPPILNESKILSFPKLSLKWILGAGNLYEFPLLFYFRSDKSLTAIYEKNHKASFFREVETFYFNLRALCTGTKFKAGLLEGAIKNILGSKETFAPNFITFLGLGSFEKDKEIKFDNSDDIWKNLKKKYVEDLIKNHQDFNQSCAQFSF